MDISAAIASMSCCDIIALAAVLSVYDITCSELNSYILVIDIRLYVSISFFCVVCCVCVFIARGFWIFCVCYLSESGDIVSDAFSTGHITDELCEGLLLCSGLYSLMS